MLQATDRISESSLSNVDLAPVGQEGRTWGLYSYLSLWVGMSVCVPTYMLASGLIAGGMNWWQAILTILLGNLIVLIPMLLNAHAGTKYGIHSRFWCEPRSEFEAPICQPCCERWWHVDGLASKHGSAAKPFTP